MITVGMDLEQFLEDPFGSGIQRVLQQLTVHWPASDVGALFAIPDGDHFVVLDRSQALSGLAIELCTESCAKVHLLKNNQKIPLYLLCFA